MTPKEVQNVSDDGMTAWQRAGGFPKEEWHAVLMWAVGKHVTAVQSRAEYSAVDQLQEGDLAKSRDKAARLRAEDEK